MRLLHEGAQYGSAPAKAALARFDTLAPGDPEDEESFVTPREKALELVEAALKSAVGLLRVRVEIGHSGFSTGLSNLRGVRK